MTFINPYLLWGALAVAIPILIHFWHQKRGTVLEWAAMQWLTEKNQQQQRGLKFDNLLLLLLRALLVIVLALLLSRPILNGFAKPKTVEPIHLVQPDAWLTTNYRFELEEALRKGEKAYWITDHAEPLTALSPVPAASTFSPLAVQAVVNGLRRNGQEVNLYLINNQQLAGLPFIHVPTGFRLHTVIDSTGVPRNFLASARTKLFVNAGGRLANGVALPQAVRYESAPVRAGHVSVLLDYRNKLERQTVVAALNALADVYTFALTIEEQRRPDVAYDVVLTDRHPLRPARQTLYIVSGPGQLPPAQNVVYTNESLTPQSSERVADGQLPEWLGDQFVAHFGLNPTRLPLTKQELDALFVPVKAASDTRSDASPTVHGGLVLVFILLIGVERWLALTRNA